MTQSTSEMTQTEPNTTWVGGHEDALAPLGISFRGKNGNLNTLKSNPHELAVAYQFLRDKFEVHCLWWCAPWVVLGRSSLDPPTQGRLPTSVGGLIPLWRDTNEDGTVNPIARTIGAMGTIKEPLRVAPSVLAGLMPRGTVIPTDDAILRLATDLFFTCEAMTFCDGYLVVEVPSTDWHTFSDGLANTPSSFLYGIQFRIHNGPLPNTPTPKQHRRIQQQPKVELVEKDDATSSIDAEELKFGRQLAHHLMYMDVNLDDEFHLNTPAGEQRLVVLGRRWQIGRRPGDQGVYISAKQGVCGTNEPTTLASKPYIADVTSRETWSAANYLVYVEECDSPMGG